MLTFNTQYSYWLFAVDVDDFKKRRQLKVWNIKFENFRVLRERTELPVMRASRKIERATLKNIFMFPLFTLLFHAFLIQFYRNSDEYSCIHSHTCKWIIAIIQEGDEYDVIRAEYKHEGWRLPEQKRKIDDIEILKYAEGKFYISSFSCFVVVPRFIRTT